MYKQISTANRRRVSIRLREMAEVGSNLITRNCIMQSNYDIVICNEVTFHQTGNLSFNANYFAL